MKTYEELMEMSYEELMKEIRECVGDTRQDHAMAVLMGSLGVSPKHMSMYFDSVKKIRQYNNGQHAIGD